MNTTQQYFRYSFLGLLIAFVPVLVIFQMVRIQLDPAIKDEFLRLTEYFTVESRTLQPTRGQIYDRWGNLLAGNKTVYEVGIDLAQADKAGSAETIAKTLNATLGLDYSEVYAKATITPTVNAVYVVVADFVPPEKVAGLKEMLDPPDDEEEDKAPEENPINLSGLKLKPHLARVYPENVLASNVLGFIDRLGTAHNGVEAQYDDMLAGESKNVLVPLDPNRAQELPSIPGGAGLILTIDRAIQISVEEILDQAIDDTGASSGTIVVMNPRNGEVLAMAVTPRLNLNEYWNYFKVFSDDVAFNRAVSQPYEPGSVFKVLTMAIGLDLGVVTPETVFIDTGSIEVGGWYITNWNLGAWGPQNMQGCMQHSLNVCLAWVATRIGAPDFYSYLQAFGLGRLTGIDLAGEVRGRLKIPGDSDWTPSDLGTNAFGQGVSTTPIQMASAISAVANRGLMMAPHIVRSVVDEGRQYDIEIRLVGSILKPETSVMLSEMLANSLETESSDALVTGYRVAGKTGTAEIPTKLGYTSNATNASFVGWGPVDDPQFLVYVWLERPLSSPWGSVVAAPVFRQVVEKLVVLINLPPDAIRLKMKGP